MLSKHTIWADENCNLDRQIETKKKNEQQTNSLYVLHIMPSVGYRRRGDARTINIREKAIIY